MGLLAQDILGSGTCVNGLACTPTTPASLSVQIGIGRLYSQQSVDLTAYGSLAADSTVITKQGSLTAPLMLSCPAPTGAGKSVNYLIQAQYQDVDGVPVVLPYYNAANPNLPLNGANNLGVAQPTQRQGTIVLQALAGASATTGSQLTPAVSAGFTALYIVTVAFGQTAINAGNIALAPGAPFINFTILTALTQAIADARYLQLYQRTPAEITAGVVPASLTINSDFLDPRRYGAVGDGVTDDTVALNAWVSVVNATTNPSPVWPIAMTFMCAPLNAITANNFTWTMLSKIKVKGNSGTGGTHVQVTGSGPRIYSLAIDGNQAAFASPGSAQLLSLTGQDVLCDSLQLTNSSARGALVSSSRGRFINCHFDSNANLGVEFEAMSYLKFVNCTFSFNGYGFQKTLATNAFQAFGAALRFRSHHCTFTNCEAFQNGLDGINVNQGSYGIKFLGCVAWMNQDGGFTIAADNTGTGKPGEGESCYDLEYINCEAYNNWSSGLVAYAPCYNVTVEGGRYYNNNRISGSATPASSFFNGIYFSGGSLGIRVRTKAYDDRQMCIVTGTTGTGPYTVSATGWVAGSAANYPNVVVYNQSMQFSGYGTIISESAGQVVISPSASNPFVGALAAGYYVSQRTQHNGCFFDNACTGTMDIDGFGQMPGVFAYAGFKGISGATAGGQNVLLPAAPHDYTELLANPTFDAGTGNGTSWTYNLPGGGAANAYTTAGANLRSPGALQLVGGTGAATGDASLIASGLSYVQGAWVEASIWCSAVGEGDASLTLFWNLGAGVLATVVPHPGGGYKQIKIGAFMPAGTTALFIRVTSAIGKTNYFDNGSLRAKSDYYDGRETSYPTRNLPV